MQICAAVPYGTPRLNILAQHGNDQDISDGSSGALALVRRKTSTSVLHLDVDRHAPMPSTHRLMVADFRSWDNPTNKPLRRWTRKRHWQPVPHVTAAHRDGTHPRSERDAFSSKRWHSRLHEAQLCMVNIRNDHDDALNALWEAQSDVRICISGRFNHACITD